MLSCLQQPRPSLGSLGYRPPLGQPQQGSVIVQAPQPLSEEDKRLVPKKVMPLTLQKPSMRLELQQGAFMLSCKRCAAEHCSDCSGGRRPCRESGAGC